MKQHVEMKIYLRGGQILTVILPSADNVTDDEFTDSVKAWEGLFGSGLVNASLALKRWGIFIPKTEAIDAIFVELKDVE